MVSAKFDSDEKAQKETLLRFSSRRMWIDQALDKEFGTLTSSSPRGGQPVGSAVEGLQGSAAVTREERKKVFRLRTHVGA